METKEEMLAAGEVRSKKCKEAWAKRRKIDLIVRDTPPHVKAAAVARMKSYGPLTKIPRPKLPRRPCATPDCPHRAKRDSKFCTLCKAHLERKSKC